MSRKTTAILLACVAAVTLVLVLAPQFWVGGAGGLSGHGWAAYILGAVLTVGLSAGLFFLTFYSSRSGHDDIDRPDDPAG